MPAGTPRPRAGSGVLRALVIGPSVVMAGFGAWHFTVPSTWGWWDAIAPEATELVLAVRAINVLFSLCLVLLGVANVALVLRRPLEPFGLALALAGSTILWATRVALQVRFPQGTQLAGVAPAMTATFVGVVLAFAAALALHLRAWRRGGT